MNDLEVIAMLHTLRRLGLRRAWNQPEPLAPPMEGPARPPRPLTKSELDRIEAARLKRERRAAKRRRP